MEGYVIMLTGSFFFVDCFSKSVGSETEEVYCTAGQEIYTLMLHPVLLQYYCVACLLVTSYPCLEG